MRFQWTPEHQRSLERVQKMLTDDMLIAYFDPQRKVKLTTHAGPGGVAATMKQSAPEAK